MATGSDGGMAPGVAADGRTGHYSLRPKRKAAPAAPVAPVQHVGAPARKSSRLARHAGRTMGAQAGPREAKSVRNNVPLGEAEVRPPVAADGSFYGADGSFYTNIGATPIAATHTSTIFTVAASMFAANVGPTWHHPDHARADEIARKVMEDRENPGAHFRGTICMYDFGNQVPPKGFGTRGIFDGVHRTAALARIVLQRQQAQCDRGEEPTWDTDIIIEVFPVRSACDVCRLVVAVNKRANT